MSLLNAHGRTCASEKKRGNGKDAGTVGMETRGESFGVFTHTPIPGKGLIERGGGRRGRGIGV